MSFVTDQVRSLDLQFDRLQLDRLAVPSLSAPTSPISGRSDPDTQQQQQLSRQLVIPPSSRVIKLQNIIKSLSTTSTTVPNATLLLYMLNAADIPLRKGIEAGSGAAEDDDTVSTQSSYQSNLSKETELEWILISKAAIQAYGVILNSLVEETIPLSEDIFYWDEVISSYRYTVLYSIQTSPLRLWSFGKEVYSDAIAKLREVRNADSISEAISQNTASTTAGLSDTLKKFYGLIKTSVRERSLLELNTRSISPFSLLRQDIKQKQAAIRKLKELQASGLGVLVNEGLSFERDEDQDDWKGVVERSIVLMENVVRNVHNVDALSIEQFEDLVFSGPIVPDEDESNDVISVDGSHHRRNSNLAVSIQSLGNGDAKDDNVIPYILSVKLQDLLSKHLPAQYASSKAITEESGKPNGLIRYWIPLSLLFLSSSTLFRILFNRKEAIKVWISELCTTVIDFWNNWVVDPAKQIIGTIRHDESAEVALMSRESLTADRDSLERMVVQFAVDNPSEGAKLNDSQINFLREKVKQGDLTPVLKVYEKDLKSPIRGAITGELLRALLIQIQKTKVDVEVAVSGIDSMLKSQQLLFGMLGLTPGILICFYTFRYLRTALGGRKGVRTAEAKIKMTRTLRNIDRIFTTSSVAANGALTGGNATGRAVQLNFKEHGLLLCEVYMLRELAKGVIPKRLMREFVDECDEVADIRAGVVVQSRVLERIRWAYAKWIN